MPSPPDAVLAEFGLALASIGRAGSRSCLLGRGLPSLPMIHALAQLGVATEQDRKSGSYTLVGVGLEGWSIPDSIDCGDSLVTLITLASLLAGRSCQTTLHTSARGAARAMPAVARTLRQRGAQIEGTLDGSDPGSLHPPYTIAPAGGGAWLAPLDIELVGTSGEQWRHPMKVSAMLSGLLADGPTRIHEAPVSDARLERLLAAAGIPLEASGPFTALGDISGEREPHSLNGELSGDLGLSLTVLGAALATPDSDVTVRGVNVGRTQSGAIEALGDAGCHLMLDARAEHLGQATANVRIAGHLPTREFALIDERAQRSSAPLPCLAAIASSCPQGHNSLLSPPGHTGAQTNKLIETLAAFGVHSQSSQDGLLVEGLGASPLRACVVDAAGDPDIAMMASALGLRATGPCQVLHADCISTRFPRFVATFRALGARIEVHEAPSP